MNRSELRKLHEREQTEARVRDTWTRYIRLSACVWVVCGAVACGLLACGAPGPAAVVATVGVLDVIGAANVALVLRRAFGMWPWRAGQ